MKIYRTTDNNYVALVAHDHDLHSAEGYEYWGAFEYSIAQDVDSGEWALYIFDLASEEVLDVDNLIGIDLNALSDLMKASQGMVQFEEIVDSDYYDRIGRFMAVLEDEVLMEAIYVEYAERD